MSIFNTIASAISPRWALQRAKAAAALRVHNRFVEQWEQKHARHYEAASVSQRTRNWPRFNGDANAAVSVGLENVRRMARDLVRNNVWASRGLSIATDDIVGWGIRAQSSSDKSRVQNRSDDAWSEWAGSTECDFDGRLNFYGIQKLVMRSIFEGGEVLVRRHRQPSDSGMKIPLKLQVLEGDFIDTMRDYRNTETGNDCIQGIEFDANGRRVAYWLFQHHPGALSFHHGDSYVSKRVPAEDVIHVFDVKRPGQARGMSEFAPLVVLLREFDEWEDAVLLGKKIAACFAAFVTDAQGTGTGIGTVDPEAQGDAPSPRIETISPGTVEYLPEGKDIKFPTPPSQTDADGFAQRKLRAVAAGLGITYEALTGDFSGANFSTARMGRLVAQRRVEHWQDNVLIPMLCNGVWAWAMQQLTIMGRINEHPTVEWTPPAVGYIDPNQEVLGIVREVRGGLNTPSEAVRARGWDWNKFLKRYGQDIKDMDAAGVIWDSDPRNMTQAGQVQKEEEDPATPPASGGG